MQQEFYNAQQVIRHHCIFCCTSLSECHCFEIQDWGPDTWYGNDHPRTWQQYLSCNGYVPHAIPEYCEHVCRSHYRRVREIIASRKCATCSTKYCDTAWKLVCDAANSVDVVHEQFAIPSESVGFFDWICNRCRLFVSDSIMFSSTILSDQSSPDPVTAQKALQINNALEKTRKEGIIFASHEIAEYKSFLHSLQTDTSVIPRMATVFSKYLERVISKQLHFLSYFPDAKKYGRVYYNDKIFNPLSIPYVYNQHLENQKLASEVNQLQVSSLRPDKIREMVKNQTTLFPSSGKRKFDYRSIITEDGSINEVVLNNYFDKELLEFVDSILLHLIIQKPTPFHHTIRTVDT